jgi:hypothetical protein
LQVHTKPIFLSLLLTRVWSALLPASFPSPDPHPLLHWSSLSSTTSNNPEDSHLHTCHHDNPIPCLFTVQSSPASFLVCLNKCVHTNVAAKHFKLHVLIGCNPSFHNE